MFGINKVILAGMLGIDPQSGITQNGKNLCKFTLATSEKYNQKETVTWHNIIAWGQTAEVMSNHLKKGSKVIIEGKIANSTWDDKQGRKCYRTDILVERFNFL